MAVRAAGAPLECAEPRSARRGRPRRSGCRAVAPPRGPSLNRPVGRPGRPTGVAENSTCCLMGSVLREGRTTPAAWLGEFGMRASWSRSPRSTACESLATSWRPSVRGWTRRKRLSLAGEKSSSSNEPASGEPDMRGRAHRLLSGCARRCAGRGRSAGAASIASSIVLRFSWGDGIVPAGRAVVAQFNCSCTLRLRAQHSVRRQALGNRVQQREAAYNFCLVAWPRHEGAPSPRCCLRPLGRPPRSSRGANQTGS